jgi:predicted nucleotidyltransferase
MDRGDQIRQAQAYLDQRFGLDALWVYGSEAKGTAGPRSDLDLGALFVRAAAPADLLDAAAELSVRLGRDVDVVDLDRASPILAMQVLRHGRLVNDANPRRRHDHFARTLSRYEDVKIIRRPMEEALYRRFAGG